MKIKHIIVVALAVLAASCSPTNRVPCGCGEQREAPTAYAVADTRGEMPGATAPRITISGGASGAGGDISR